MNIKLIAVDLDRTVLTHKKKIPKKTKKNIQKQDRSSNDRAP